MPDCGLHAHPALLSRLPRSPQHSITPPWPEARQSTRNHSTHTRTSESSPGTSAGDALQQYCHSTVCTQQRDFSRAAVFVEPERSRTKCPYIHKLASDHLIFPAHCGCNQLWSLFPLYECAQPCILCFTPLSACLVHPGIRPMHPHILPCTRLLHPMMSTLRLHYTTHYPTLPNTTPGIHKP